MPAGITLIRGIEQSIQEIADRMHRLQVEGLICIGGDGTLSGMQVLSDFFPTVLAPKTIDNDLGLNYRTNRTNDTRDDQRNPRLSLCAQPVPRQFDLDQIINYVTPGYATAVFVSATGVQRVRTTAESHRRIAIVEVMGRHSGYLALGAAYGQPDIVLIPESPLNVDRLVERVIEMFDLQKNVVIVSAEGVVDEKGEELGASSNPPSGRQQDPHWRGRSLAADPDPTAGGDLFHGQTPHVRPGPRFSPGKSAIRSAAAGRCNSITSTEPSWVDTPSTCCWKGR